MWKCCGLNPMSTTDAESAHGCQHPYEISIEIIAVLCCNLASSPLGWFRLAWRSEIFLCKSCRDRSWFWKLEVLNLWVQNNGLMHKVRNLCMKIPPPSLNGRATSLPWRLMFQSEPQHGWGRCDVAMPVAKDVLTHNFQKGFEDGRIPILQLTKGNSKVICHIHTN